jgi:hypothetical protein
MANPAFTANNHSAIAGWNSMSSPRMRAAAAATPTNRIIVVDEKNMVRLWLEEKLAQRELTPAEADKYLEDYEDEGKTWVGPFKDSLGDAGLVQKLVKDMGSWRGARVVFAKGKTGDLVIIKGLPNERKLITGTRYKVTNPKMIEMQIGKPGIRAAARDSARFGIYLVVAVDVLDYIVRDKATFGQLLGHLSFDIPAVAIAAAVGAEAGALATGLLVVGSFACGPFLVALAVGIAVGWGLSELDAKFHISEKLGEEYDKGLSKLRAVWQELERGTEHRFHQAEQKFHQIENSRQVQDLSRGATAIAANIGRGIDSIQWRISLL